MYIVLNIMKANLQQKDVKYIDLNRFQGIELAVLEFRKSRPIIIINVYLFMPSKPLRPNDGLSRFTYR